MVDEKREPAPKKLEDVRGEIEKIIREREAPAYAAEHAQKLLRQWKDSGKSLVDFAKSVNLSSDTTQKALTENEDPSIALKGLTSNILVSAGAEEKLLAELDKFSVLVEVSAYHEISIPPFAEVRQKVTADLTKINAKKLALTKANDLVAALQQSTYANLDAACKALKLTCEKGTGISRSGGGTGPFMQSEIRQAVLGTKLVGEKPSASYAWGQKMVVFEVTAINKPDPASATEAIADTQKRATEDNTRVLLTSLVNKLKAEAKIDIDPSLMREARS